MKKNGLELPDCPDCTAAVAVDQDGVVHHEGHTQHPYGMQCRFAGSPRDWIQHVASRTRCPFCNRVPTRSEDYLFSHECDDLYAVDYKPSEWLKTADSFRRLGKALVAPIVKALRPSPEDLRWAVEYTGPTTTVEMVRELLLVVRGDVAPLGEHDRKIFEALCDDFIALKRYYRVTKGRRGEQL